MIFYYNDVGYPMTWKSEMRDNMWYNMEPAKIKVTMPYSLYMEILNQYKINSVDKLLFFEVLKSNSDIVKWGISNKNIGIWKIEACIYSMSISSKFRNGDVITIFDIAVCESIELDEGFVKQRLRDELLRELV